MFPGMDPEMLKVAQEQMRRMKPEDLQRMQQMMTPEMTKFAMENMRKMKPEDMRAAAEQMRQMSPEQMGPENLDQAAVQMGQMMQYELSAATSLKNQGNQLHNAGKYLEATQKYEKAKSNLATHTTAEAAQVKTACSLNLMSCFLKLGMGQKVVTEGLEVLGHDPNSVKALYRRGQAYKEMGKLKLAVSDLSKAADLSPADDTLREVLRDAQTELADKGEEAEAETDGEDTVPHISTPGAAAAIEVEQTRKDPEAMRGIHAMMSSMDPETMAAMSGGAVTPEMARTAAAMMKNMSPEAMEAMMNLGGGVGGVGGGEMPQMTPQVQEAMKEKMRDPNMMAMMTEMMKNVDSDTLVRMSEQAGMKITAEQAEQTKEAMASMTPAQMERVMKFAQGADSLRKAAMQAKAWILANKLVVLALLVLILGLILQRFNVI